MTATTIAGHTVEVDAEGFLANPEDWSEDLAVSLAAQIGIELGEDHWTAIRFARQDYAEKGETPTPRRIATVGGVPIKRLFELFPAKPGKKIAYVAGLPKPRGCV